MFSMSGSILDALLHMKRVLVIYQPHTHYFVVSAGHETLSQHPNFFLSLAFTSFGKRGSQRLTSAHHTLITEQCVLKQPIILLIAS